MYVTVLRKGPKCRLILCVNLDLNDIIAPAAGAILLTLTFVACQYVAMLGKQSKKVGCTYRNGLVSCSLSNRISEDLYLCSLL